jgi:hypothetical protein
MKVQDFIQEFVDKKISNTKINPNAVEEFIKSKLKIRTFIPFVEKRKIVELIVSANTTEEYNIKKIDSVSQFVGFVTGMLMTHTDLELDQADPIKSYDALSEAGLLEPIIACFQKDYSECEVLLKMTVADTLADNELSVVVARFLNGILNRLDEFGEAVKDKFEDLDLSSILGADFNKEDIAQLMSVLNKLK